MNNHTNITQKELTSQRGFTLVELIAGIALSLAVGGLALKALSTTQRGFAADRNNIENGQKLSSVLDIISSDIRQAGEQISESSFPVVQVINDGSKGSKLILYRAITEPLGLCQALPASIAATSIVTTSNNSSFNITNPSCTPESTGTSPDPAKAKCDNYPNKQQEWCKIRFNVVKMPGILHNLSGTLQPFVYTSETPDDYNKTNSSKNIVSITTDSFTPTVNFPVNSTAYIIEKRAYLICNNQLKVWINATDTDSCPATEPVAIDPTRPFRSFQTIATNVEKMDIITSIRTPAATSTDPDVVSSLTANSAFPTATETWQSIQGLNIKLRTTHPEGKSFSSLSTQEQEKLVVEGKFYPRNIMSAKRKN
jgi:prepilin-type N-terminal cleavage/methylation domain-containing protein